MDKSVVKNQKPPKNEMLKNQQRNRVKSPIKRQQKSVKNYFGFFR